MPIVLSPAAACALLSASVNSVIAWRLKRTHRRQLSFPLGAPKANQPCRQCRDCSGAEPRRGQLILV